MTDGLKVELRNCKYIWSTYNAIKRIIGNLFYDHSARPYVRMFVYLAFCNRWLLERRAVIDGWS